MWRTFIRRGVTPAGLHSDNDLAATAQTRLPPCMFLACHVPGLNDPWTAQEAWAHHGDPTPPAETARPSNTGNNSPAVRPAWQRRASTRHAWTAAARVKSEPKKKTLAPSQGSTGPARPGTGRQMAEARKRGDLPAVANQQCTEGTHQVGPCHERRRSKKRTTITAASPAPRTRDCARVVHMRARWLTYVCVPLHGEGDGQHVTWPRESGCYGALAGMATVGGCPTTMHDGPAARRIRAVGHN